MRLQRCTFSCWRGGCGGGDVLDSGTGMATEIVKLIEDFASRNAQLKRANEQLGTKKDTPDFRSKLARQRDESKNIVRPPHTHYTPLTSHPTRAWMRALPLLISRLAGFIFPIGRCPGQTHHPNAQG